MLKKTITYTDYNDEERTEDFYFNLNKAEVTKMELGVQGGYSAMLNRILSNKDGPTIMKTFDQFIKDSYGVKTPNGGFVKSKEVLDEFLSKEAYSILFMELCTDSKAASDFLKGVLPKDLPKPPADAPKQITATPSGSSE